MITIIKKHHIYTPNLKKNYLNIVRGEGIYLYDSNGNKYLDSTGGPFSCSIGHGREDMAQALYNQASTLEFAYRVYSINPALLNVTEKLNQITGYSKFMIVSGGTEANETAFKIVRQYYLEKGCPDKHLIIGKHFSYHGSSMFTLSTAAHLGFREKYQPYIKEQAHIPPSYCYRCWYNEKPENCDVPCAKALEEEIIKLGPNKVAALFIETISGTSLACAYPQNRAYFNSLQEICNKYDVLIIADEVLVGSGRTGKFNAYEHFNFKPDIFTLGKGIGGGYIPAAVVGVNKKVIDVIETGKGVMGIGFTMTNQPMQCAAILKTLDIMEEERLIDSVGEREPYIRNSLEKLKAAHPTIGIFNGMGLLWGLEFVKDKASKEVLPQAWNFAGEIATQAEKRGLLTLAYGQVVNKEYLNHQDIKGLLEKRDIANGLVGDKIMLTPPLIIKDTEIDIIFERLDEAIGEVEKKYGY